MHGRPTRTRGKRGPDCVSPTSPELLTRRQPRPTRGAYGPLFRPPFPSRRKGKTEKQGDRRGWGLQLPSGESGGPVQPRTRGVPAAKALPPGTHAGVLLGVGEDNAKHGCSGRSRRASSLQGSGAVLSLQLPRPNVTEAPRLAGARRRSPDVAAPAFACPPSAAQPALAPRRGAPCRHRRVPCASQPRRQHGPRAAGWQRGSQRRQLRGHPDPLRRGQRAGTDAAWLRPV